MSIRRERPRQIRAGCVFRKHRLLESGNMGLIVGMLNDEDREVRQAAVAALTRIATNADAEGLLDLLAERSQGRDSIARSHYAVLCLLDRKFYSPIPQEHL